MHNYQNIKNKYLMKLIEFKAVDNSGNEFMILIDPEYIESLTVATDKSRIGIGLVSGKTVDVKNTLQEVIDKMESNVESTDYKRTDKVH